MVDLPPSTEELNEYGKYAFLNEMLSIANDILSFVHNDHVYYSLVKKAISFIDQERANMKEMFSEPYQRPEEKNISALILRCSELYLSNGSWFDLSRAEVRVVESQDCKDINVEDLRDCFSDPSMTERLVIRNIPIIELTLARIDMMQYFKTKQEETFTGLNQANMDYTNKFKLPEMPYESEIDKFNNTNISEDFSDPDDLVIGDIEYLELREKTVWSVLSDLRFFGSLGCSVYFLVFFILNLVVILQAITPVHVTVLVGAGYCLLNLLIELFSLRACLIWCCKPKEAVGCIYPGFTLYVFQYCSTFVFCIAMLVSFFVFETSPTPLYILYVTIHCLVSLIWPLCTKCFLFQWHHRVERKFLWIRIRFFRGCSWKLYSILSIILLSPSVYGIQLLLVSALVDKPRLTRMRDQQLLTSV